MKAFKNLIIRRKLASFRPVFPHDDSTNVDNIESIYDDILEFTRPGLYPESATRAAWKLLLLQIGHGPTSLLMQALAKRPPVEVAFFFSTLMSTCMNDVDELNYSPYREEGPAMVSSSSKEMLVLPPVLGFIAWVMTQVDWGCKTVLETGILDMLLHVYIVFASLSDTAVQDADLKEALRGACRLILVILGQSLEHQTMVFNHPVCVLWTGGYSPPSEFGGKYYIQDRCASWRRVDRSYVMRRALAVYRGTLRESEKDVADLCADIVEFTNVLFYDSEIIDFAFLVIFKQIVSNGAEHLINVLAKGSRESTVRVFSGIIRLWLEHISMQVEDEMTDNSLTPMTNSFYVSDMQRVPIKVIHKTFCSREKEVVMMKIMNSDASLYHMLRFATETAKQNATVRSGMLGAGSLALALTAFANADFRLSSLDIVPAPQGPKSEIGKSVNGETPLPISPAAINAEASTLSFFIHSPKFKKSWHGQRLETRLSLCSSLVFALLGRDERPDEGYEVTRALFRKAFVVEL
ncbi:hypothetical protein PILCRDRAFT_335112 [Piloderma croceum F 1598]|uniref:Uncharacterized protein n=1 Tax=Piloderma croceum (strain F 1598) TaxID=765440 RepID=A0A0C3G2T0_PILCF|nr:hypothetical protein PILCRDRAFT_335112 [Piloderma croceum F 1598]